MEKRGQVLLGSRGGMDGSRRLQSLSQPARQFHCSALAPLFTVCFTHAVRRSSGFGLHLRPCTIRHLFCYRLLTFVSKVHSVKPSRFTAVNL
jgi:hypothetical protein